MKTRLINYWQSLRTSFWLVPALMVVLAIIMSVNMVTLDRALQLGSLQFYGYMYSVSPEGARSVLSTIAGSMMTVAGVTFSITIVVLNLASSQFGPRLIRNFMQDRGTQFVLGSFVASFIYCLLVLRSIDTVGKEIFVPNFSVIFAVLLALLNVGVLIFFIHHIATSIQADKVIAEISNELELNIRRIFTEELDYENTDERRRLSKLPEEKKDHYYTHQITARRNGYLQAIDSDGLLQIAKNYDYLIEIRLRPGQFVAAAGTLATVISDGIFDVSLTDRITDAFIVGAQRTPEQDAEYPIHQLVEVAVRALSPGINDPYTAITCIDQLGSTLCFLAQRVFPPSCCFDEQDKLRMRVKSFTYSGILNTSFDQIRQYGRTSVAVVIRLLEMLTIITEQTRDSDQRKAIHRQANMIFRGSQEALAEENDKEDVLERYRVLLSTLNEFDDKEGPYESSDGLPIS
ncbi:MAG: DUF2254 domain-containing protein [Desulforhopalus sp.]